MSSLAVWPIRHPLFNHPLQSESQDAYRLILTDASLLPKELVPSLHATCGGDGQGSPSASPAFMASSFKPEGLQSKRLTAGLCGCHRSLSSHWPFLARDVLLQQDFPNMALSGSDLPPSWHPCQVVQSSRQ
eukprot:scaffold247526_cov16-Tisochrysis_lutea.AAC.1